MTQATTNGTEQKLTGMEAVYAKLPEKVKDRKAFRRGVRQAAKAGGVDYELTRSESYRIPTGVNDENGDLLYLFLTFDEKTGEVGQELATYTPPPPPEPKAKKVRPTKLVEDEEDEEEDEEDDEDDDDDE